MKLIKITDRNSLTHYINPSYIVRVEDHNKMIIVFTSDGAGIRSDMSFSELMGLLSQ